MLPNRIFFLKQSFHVITFYRCTGSCLPCHLRNCCFETLECAVNTEGSNIDITFQNQQNLISGLYCNKESHCSAMDLLSYECKESEKSDRRTDECLKGQITDPQTVVFIVQIKFFGFGGGRIVTFI